MLNGGGEIHYPQEKKVPPPSSPHVATSLKAEVATSAEMIPTLKNRVSIHLGFFGNKLR